MMIDARLVKIAYKKLKSSLYYDKTENIVRDKLVDFEVEKDNIDAYLDAFTEEFLNAQTRAKLFDDILSTISFFVLPKKLKQNESKIIKNYSPETLLMESIQHFIDMDIRGHILGVLWLLTIGYRVDKNVYVNSYGNRIREKLYNEFSGAPTYSPYLFEPYFQQYESWRDKALDAAKRHLQADQDVMVMTLDFQRFYYSVDITKALMDEIYETEIVKNNENCDEYLALNEFVYRVIEKYAGQFDECAGRNILPIGFLPSNVLANYALRNFDRAVLNGWNPIYFGRYVDDIIIVDKIEQSSDLFQKAKDGTLEKDDIISYYLEQCSGWNGLTGATCGNVMENSGFALFYKKNGDLILNPLYNPDKNDTSKIVIQDDKVKIFYFKTGETDAMLTCFRETIAKNKSEFRHMPEDEMIFQNDDFSVIYDLKNEETINKFRGISGITIDRFELSKLLGKHLRIGGMINDVRETGFETQILKIMNPCVIIENYTVWEKILEILVINESWGTLKEITKNITDAIQILDYKNKQILVIIQQTMQRYLSSCLSRTLALVWGAKAEDTIKKICEKNTSQSHNVQGIDEISINRRRIEYCMTRMLDKSVMPIFIDMLDMATIYAENGLRNLTNFEQMLEYCKKEWEGGYKYYPYLITMYDFSMISCITQLQQQNGAFSDLEGMYRGQVRNYEESNYYIDVNADSGKEWIQVNSLKENDEEEKNKWYLLKIDNDKKDKLRLAIANIRLNHQNFEKVVIGTPNRSYQRYKELSKIINEALDERADMLIMPESYLPFEWLTTVARTCARGNLAVVTGIEHIKIHERIFNLTAVILPYDDSINKTALIAFHLKTHYAPAEKQEINGYRCNEVAGTHYELYQWHNCYFPVYCCYELTSINDRAFFQSYADFLVTIEWNRDVKYYSNILESLSRDVHCYCVQVNSSDYGDSRISKPSKSEDKDIMRTKGGKNSTILVDEIDIKGMREFQLKEYHLQAYDKRFKPTPPGFKPEIVLKKIKGESLI